MTSRVQATHRAPAPYGWRRGLSLAAAATLVGLGAPLLAGSPASADPEGDTVTFQGGCGLLGSGFGAGSTPDAAEVTVPAGSKLRFANGLDQSAVLRLDGEPAAQVPAGGAAEVVFHDGPVTASMQISCLMGSPAGSVTVAVQEVDQPQRPAPPSAAPGGSPSAGPSPNRPSPSSSSPSSGSSSSASSSGSSSNPGPAAVPPAAAPGWSGAPAAPGVVPGVPGGFGPDSALPAAGQPGGAPSDDHGEEPGDGDELSSARWGIEPDGGGGYGDPANVEPEPAAGGVAVDELSRTAGSSSDDGPIGLLALVATVCVVGVAAGAIRALITQRANRAEWA
jgi:hypothetical protein